nr:hypothetical protein [Tanacetum cinerariifolium]
MQTQTSNTLHNAIMEAGSKDHPLMLAPGNYVQWKSRIKRYIDTNPNHELIHYCLMNPPYKMKVLIYDGSPVTRTESQIKTYKTVSQDIRDQLNAEAEAVQIILTRIDNDIYSTIDDCPNACEMWKAIERFYKMMNELIRNQCDVTNHQVNVQFLLQLQPEWQRFVTLVKQSQELKTVSYHKLYDILKQHLECQKPKRAKDAAYHREKMLLCKQEEARIQLNAEQADWTDDTDDDELEDQELETHYIEHPEQSKSVHDTYPIKQDAHNVIIDSLDMSYDREEIDQNANDNNLANERELLASLIEKLKCEIDENKNCNKFLKTSNNVLIEKLKGEIEDFKNKNKSLESSNNRFKEANNKLSETNNLLYTDFKMSEAELARRNNMEYASKMEIECAQKEAQIKLYKTCEDKELDKVIALENKVKVLDIIVYKTGQSVQMMNMLNNKRRTSFVKFEFFKKAQRANPRLYDIEKIADRTCSGYLDPFIQNTIEANFSQTIKRINAGLQQFPKCLNEEMVADLRYFNSLELEVDSLKSQLETQKTQFLNEIDRLSREYYYADHMNAILGAYTELDEVTNLQSDYLELLEKCECLETELSKSKMMSKSFEALQKHAINFEIDLQQCQEKIKNDKSFIENPSKEFRKEREQYFEIQDLKAQLQDKGIVIRIHGIAKVYGGGGRYKKPNGVGWWLQEGGRRWG